MNTILQTKVRKIVSSTDLGVSFSIIPCEDFGYDWRLALKSTIELGFTRFRLMSYWSMHEKVQGTYDFKALDAQLAQIKKSGGRVTLSIGIRQPRWPETHVPKWTEDMPAKEVVKKYLKFHRAVIERYKGHSEIESWQLENEFWLRSFGYKFDFSRHRLKHEFDIIRALDPERPIIMSVAHVGSLPLRGPKPDIYATSMYRVVYNYDKEVYTRTKIKPWHYRVKRLAIKLIRRRELIVHELQAEPWGPKGNPDLSTEEQFKSIDREEIAKAVAYARASGITYIDLWGAEWWYWRKTTFSDDKVGPKVAALVSESSGKSA